MIIECDNPSRSASLLKLLDLHYGEFYKQQLISAESNEFSKSININVDLHPSGRFGGIEK